MAHSWKVTNQHGEIKIVEAGTKSGAKIAASGLGLKGTLTATPDHGAVADAYAFHLPEQGCNASINRSA